MGGALVRWRARLFDSRWKSRNLNATQLSRKPLHRYLRTELHDTIGRNGEVFGSASGVLREENVELLAPPRETSSAGWKQPLSAQIVGGVSQVGPDAEVLAPL